MLRLVITAVADEGLMTEDVESGVSVVLKAVKDGDLPAEEVIAWCSTMLATDHTGFIAKEPLRSLQAHFQAKL